MTEWKVGQSLTYEQAMSLPDGAVWSAVWKYDETRLKFMGAPAEEKTDQFGIVRYHTHNIEDWHMTGWHSARLESLPEPANPQRVASEIEKRAALALLETMAYEVRDVTGGDLDHIDAFNCLEFACRKFVDAYDYAKSIGAIA